ncbi:FAD-dependent oxidoreductase [Novosphingobium resinovorum]|uniref:NADH dehydrogenase, FAD-containing subunit n=1 Tax=Novosphingobium resinovorum TaxID=158500 RepID=A0A031JS56_9SPHN|nr:MULTISPECIES: FAD-dependent oxidoreductase [Sphingomonadaceae]AOR79445.1 pyridine nucleotide-disulfide oxidoreductase [Novosphingobium resinovorum]EJU12791.1 NADH dehydrogenase, FAD-containing subunit [Sphingomonas sp. LH128]EZP80621.1 NADH dehydrogenase, FAD-containing subunit [Novosphingobium resinovorum]MBF7013642.1 FAD-dependent oxidoreductase [Novosphingobium sp. HR1a]WJM25791.1 FAD-dependent oxidoreductase [Novosphingobium resinovorum]
MSKQTILIAGTGFAGVWAALSATRAIALAGREDDVEVVVVSPSPTMVIRPRLYEAVLENMNPDVSALLAAVGARYVAGLVEAIGATTQQATILRGDGGRETIAWDRFVLATGSRLSTPPIPGIADHAFDVDQLDSAQRLDEHLGLLAARTDEARGTAVVVGGGFTGLEGAAEMPERLRAILGKDAPIRVVIVDPAEQIAAEMGADAAVVVRGALDELGVEQRPGVRVTAVDAGGVTLSDGSRIDAATVVWSAGMRAHPLAGQVPGEHDATGRVLGDVYLRAPEASGIFVTGDTVKAATDDIGNFTVMSCQHALSLGRVAGHNAAAELVGLDLHPYSQPKYVTCLDLGAWGALYTEGWDRQVHLTRAEGKKLKQEINGVWIYPPAPEREAVFAVSNPDFVIVL